MSIMPFFFPFFSFLLLFFYFFFPSYYFSFSFFFLFFLFLFLFTPFPFAFPYHLVHSRTPPPPSGVGCSPCRSAPSAPAVHLRPRHAFPLRLNSTASHVAAEKEMAGSVVAHRPPHLCGGVLPTWLRWTPTLRPHRHLHRRLRSRHHCPPPPLRGTPPSLRAPPLCPQGLRRRGGSKASSSSYPFNTADGLQHPRHLRLQSIRRSPSCVGHRRPLVLPRATGWPCARRTSSPPYTLPRKPPTSPRARPEAS